MVLSSEEIQLAHQILTGLQNATGYSYETMVRGTAIVSLLNTAVIVVAIVVAIIAAIWANRYIARKIDEGTYQHGDPGTIGGALIAFCIAGVVTFVIMTLLTEAIQGYLVPEYTVMNKVLDMVTSR